MSQFTKKAIIDAFVELRGDGRRQENRPLGSRTVKRPPCVKGAGFLQSKKTGGLLSADDQQSLRQKSKIFATSLYTREAFYFVLYRNKQDIWEPKCHLLGEPKTLF